VRRKLKNVRLILPVVLLLMVALAGALPPYWSTFEEHYTPEPGSALAEARCLTCHVQPDGGRRNPYGQAVQDALRQSPESVVTMAILRQVEELDSNGNGRTNLQEIRDGLPPGAAVQPGQEAPAEPMVPRHSFHPLVIHFPIALFLFGTLLEIWGRMKASSDLRRLGFYNLAAGAVASPIAAVTGIVAMLRMGLPFEGLVRIHFTLAVVSTALMVLLVVWRRKGELDSNKYWVALVATTVLLSLAGHFGAMMVWS
jgi:uncharacterized membrane protein